MHCQCVQARLLGDDDENSVTKTQFAGSLSGSPSLCPPSYRGAQGLPLVDQDRPAQLRHTICTIPTILSDIPCDILRYPLATLRNGHTLLRSFAILKSLSKTICTIHCLHHSRRCSAHLKAFKNRRHRSVRPQPLGTVAQPTLQQTHGQVLAGEHMLRLYSPATVQRTAFT